MSLRALAAGGLAALSVLAVACTYDLTGTGAPGSSDGASDGGSPDSSGEPLTSSVDAAVLCDLLVGQCRLSGFTLADCIDTFSLARTTASCASRARYAACSTVAELRSACFPACTQAEAPNHCNDDGTNTVCGSNGWTYRIDCNAYCAANGRAWTGQCGRTNPATGALGEVEQCWCR